MPLTSYPEPLVARVTGIAKHTIVAARKAKLTKEEHWTVERNVVCLTPAGLEKLLGVLGLASAALAWPESPGADTPPAESEAREEAAGGAGEASTGPAIPASPEKIAEVRERWPWPHSPALATAAPIELTVAAVAVQVQQIQGAAVVELTVRRCSTNPSLVHAVGSDGVEVLVRVASNAHFLPGMKFQARPPGKDGPRVFALVGHCPRWRGRW